MIQPNELRIGSRYYHSAAQRAITLDAQWITYFSKYTDILEPIPITEACLISFGFQEVKSNISQHYEEDTFDGQRQFRYDYEGMAIQTVMSGFIWRLPKIKYAHQFQNLFHALTGKELTLEE